MTNNVTGYRGAQNPERLLDATASIFAITNEDIQRVGAAPPSQGKLDQCCPSGNPRLTLRRSVGTETVARRRSKGG